MEGEGRGEEGVDEKGSEWRGRKRGKKKMRVEGPLLWIIDTPLLLLVILTYCYKSENRYYKTNINKTVKLHVLSSAVLEIENVNAKAINF